LGDGKDENLEKSKNTRILEGYGVSIELIVCLKYSPNVAISTYCLQKYRHTEEGFPSGTHPFNVSIQRDSLKTKWLV